MTTMEKLIKVTDILNSMDIEEIKSLSEVLTIKDGGNLMHANNLLNTIKQVYSMQLTGGIKKHMQK